MSLGIHPKTSALQNTALNREYDKCFQHRYNNNLSYKIVASILAYYSIAGRSNVWAPPKRFLSGVLRNLLGPLMLRQSAGRNENTIEIKEERVKHSAGGDINLLKCQPEIVAVVGPTRIRLRVSPKSDSVPPGLTVLFLVLKVIPGRMRKQKDFMPFPRKCWLH